MRYTTKPFSIKLHLTIKAKEVEMKKILFILLLLSTQLSFGQLGDLKTQEVSIDGKVYTAIISKYDTILLADLDYTDITITAPREFADYDEMRRYYRFKRYAKIVFPYAMRAVKTYHDVKDTTLEMSNRESRRHVRDLQNQLEEELKETLKDLTKQQGYILTKMIEKELEGPIYDIIKDFKNGFSATYWNTLGMFYGYDLKEGYIEGKDDILDMVLEDYKMNYIRD